MEELINITFFLGLDLRLNEQNVLASLML